MYRIESFLSARLFLVPEKVDKQVFFVSNISGRLSLYKMKVGGSVPEPLLPPEISLQNPHLIGNLYKPFPKLGKILVMVDNDGDEDYKPMLVSMNGGYPEPAFTEMMDAMGMVIGPAAALACGRLTEDELNQLDEVVNSSEIAASQSNFVRIAQLDYEFHRILAEATGNRHLSRYLLHLHQVATRFNFAAWKRDRNAVPSIDEHRQIVEIMRQRDIEAAKVSMRAHIENARQRIVGSMAATE